MYRRTISTVFLVMSLILAGALPAFAGHDHFVETPNGKCHQVAKGQTSINDSTHGGYHRFHANVHVGATDDGNRDLGKGHSRVNVYKENPPPPQEQHLPEACS